ncbi:cytochrome oxidase complex assembly protein 1-domain-containing protein [Mycena maculata]|uniref:Cytochrome oxidase complex assembly protein 1-domain-containing protein n=1 Tax=Mycena maculata TaxID=230809 RepID=A0AAD7JSQ9_9AGAR|nr:cytochrome oxidase complex assembly protein 1-domain-containing protein [Mycena maculata]
MASTLTRLDTVLPRASRNALRQSFNKTASVTQIRRYTEDHRVDRASLYSNFKSHRELPRIEKRWPAVLGLTAVVLTGWSAFLTYVTNETKVTSSVVKQIMRTLKADPQLTEALGLAIRPQPEWWLNGYPIIHGQINQLQGNIDLSFRIKGSMGSGTVYFTSVRKAKGIPYEILRFRVILDDGRVVQVETSPEPQSE